MATTALDAVTSTATSATYAVGRADYINVAVYSATTSTASVVIECQMSTTAPWFTMVTVTDPAAAGELWSIPRTANLRVRVASRSAGTISAEIEAYLSGQAGNVL